MLSDPLVFKAAVAGTGSDISLKRVRAGEYTLGTVTFPDQYKLVIRTSGSTSGNRQVSVKLDYVDVPADLNQSGIGRSSVNVVLSSNQKQSLDISNARESLAIILGILLNSTHWTEILADAL